MSGITSSVPGRIVVGVADLRVAPGPPGELVTHALGSCIGLTVWDPETRVGGMLHYVLARPRERERAVRKPAMYAVAGVPALFDAVSELGAKTGRLVVCAAGGSEILCDQGGFSIGQRNRTMLRKLFWKNGIALHAEDCGGSVSRHMALDLETGRVTVHIKNEESVLWQRSTSS